MARRRPHRRSAGAARAGQAGGAGAEQPLGVDRPPARPRRRRRASGRTSCVRHHPAAERALRRPPRWSSDVTARRRRSRSLGRQPVLRPRQPRSWRGCRGARSNGTAAVVTVTDGCRNACSTSTPSSRVACTSCRTASTRRCSSGAGRRATRRPGDARLRRRALRRHNGRSARRGARDARAARPRSARSSSASSIRERGRCRSQAPRRRRHGRAACEPGSEAIERVLAADIAVAITTPSTGGDMALPIEALRGARARAAGARARRPSAATPPGCSSGSARSTGSRLRTIRPRSRPRSSGCSRTRRRPLSAEALADVRPRPDRRALRRAARRGGDALEQPQRARGTTTSRR